MKKAVYFFVLVFCLSIFSQPNQVKAGGYFSDILEKITWNTQQENKSFFFAKFFSFQNRTILIPNQAQEGEELNNVTPSQTLITQNINTETTIQTQNPSSISKLLEMLRPKKEIVQQGNSTNSFSDCQIPKGKIAFSINSKDGSGEQCGANVVFSGYEQYFKKGVFGGGYVNPMLEKGKLDKNASVGNCARKDVAEEYGEQCFTSYDMTSPGFVHVQTQLIHWQHEGELNNQKCVPIYLDNCDSIGIDNYRKILDSIERLNNSGNVKLKVLISSPQNDCNLFQHPAVVGALVEEIDNQNLQKVVQMRTNPQQVLLFTRGGKGTNEKLKEIESLKIPNSAYSYDSGKEYEMVNSCTYHP